MSAPIADRRVAAVIPTYNEALTIAVTIRELLDQPCRPDVFIVDDNSPDGTARVVRNAARYTPRRVHLIEGSHKRGIGRAYADGFAAAISEGYDVIVQLDADGSHPCTAIGDLIDSLRDADLAIGSRYIPGGRAPGLGATRSLLSRAANTYARGLLRLGVHDLTGGFKAWRRDALIAAGSGTTTSDGYAFQIEMTWRASCAGAVIHEVPIEFAPRRAGASKMDWAIAAEALRVVPRFAVTRMALPTRARPAAAVAEMRSTMVTAKAHASSRTATPTPDRTSDR